MGFMTCVQYVAHLHCMLPSGCAAHFDMYPATHTDGRRKRIVNDKLKVLNTWLRVFNTRTEAKLAVHWRNVGSKQRESVPQA
jgi:hypothetical protein